MKDQPETALDMRDALPSLPRWVSSGAVETVETIAFRAGAVLAVLDQLIRDPRQGVPVKLLANRLALRAAVATSKLEGRLAREADIRDAYHLTLPGEARGPDGDLLAFWRAATIAPEWEDWLRDGAAQARRSGPFIACCAALRLVLEADDRAERAACLLSDHVLARAMDWPKVLPVTALYLSKAKLRALAAGHGDLAVQAALLQGLIEGVRLAQGAGQGATKLRAVAPKLRSKGAARAVEVFLTEDAVAPSGPLARHMTDRAARRFCDRLVELGVARELTGRATFRLYGIVP